jgi:hypothetical protein
VAAGENRCVEDAVKVDMPVGLFFFIFSPLFYNEHTSRLSPCVYILIHNYNRTEGINFVHHAKEKMTMQACKVNYKISP